MLIRVAQLRPRRIRRHGKTSMGTLLVLIALGVTLAVPASASATGVHVSPVSAIEPRFPYLPPTARPATRTTTSPWLTGGTAALIVMGTFALALWTESRHADHSGLDEGDDWARGDPDVPPRPKAPGGEDLHWSLFEAEFRAYVASHERRRDLIAAL